MLAFATQDSDWVLPLDADWELTGDRSAIRAELAASQADALDVPFHTPLNPNVKLETVAASTWHEELAGETAQLPLILRVLGDMRVEDFHWFYSGVKDGQRVWLWGYDSRYPKAETAVLQAPMGVTHHCFFRDERTIEANRAYCADRALHVAAHGVEP
jgi:hypothetical protein